MPFIRRAESQNQGAAYKWREQSCCRPGWGEERGKRVSTPGSCAWTRQDRKAIKVTQPCTNNFFQQLLYIDSIPGIAPGSHGMPGGPSHQARICTEKAIKQLLSSMLGACITAEQCDREAHVPGPQLVYAGQLLRAQAGWWSTSRPTVART
jgi:hypothetical protein